MDIALRNGEFFKIEKIEGKPSQKKTSVYLIFNLFGRQNPPEELYAPNNIEGDTTPDYPIFLHVIRTVFHIWKYREFRVRCI